MLIKFSPRIACFLGAIVVGNAFGADLIWMPGAFQTAVAELRQTGYYKDDNPNSAKVCTDQLKNDPQLCSAFMALKNKYPNPTQIQVDSNAELVVRKVLSNAYARGFRIIDISVNSGPRQWWNKSWSFWLTQTQKINDSLYSKCNHCNDPLKMRVSIVMCPWSSFTYGASFPGSLPSVTADTSTFKAMQVCIRLTAKYVDSVRRISPKNFMDLLSTTDTSALLKLKKSPLPNDTAINGPCLTDPSSCSDTTMTRYFSSLYDSAGTHLWATSSTPNLSNDEVDLWVAGYTGWIIDSVAYLIDSLTNGKQTMVTPIQSVCLRTTASAETSLYPDDMDRNYHKRQLGILSFPNTNPAKNLEYSYTSTRGNASRERIFFNSREDLYDKFLAWFNAAAISHMIKYPKFYPTPSAGFYFQASNNAQNQGSFDLFRTIARTKIGFVIPSIHALFLGDSIQYQYGLFGNTASAADSIKKLVPNFFWDVEYSSPFISGSKYANQSINWDSTFLATPDGHENANAYYAEAQAAIKLGAAGISYGNWPPQMFVSPPDDTVWSKIIGPKKASNAVKTALDALPLLPKSNIGVYLPSNERITSERTDPFTYLYLRDINHYLTHRMGTYKKITYLTDSLLQYSKTPMSGIDTLYVLYEYARSRTALPIFAQDSMHSKLVLRFVKFVQEATPVVSNNAWALSPHIYFDFKVIYPTAAALNPAILNP